MNRIWSSNTKFEGKVYYDKNWKYLWFFNFLTGIVLSVIIYGFMPGAAKEGGIFLAVMFAFAIVASGLLGIGYARFEILVKEDCLVVTPMFKRTEVVTYEQLTSARYSGTAKVLVLMKGEKRLISVEKTAVGYQELCELCREKGKI